MKTATADQMLALRAASTIVVAAQEQIPPDVYEVSTQEQFRAYYNATTTRDVAQAATKLVKLIETGNHVLQSNKYASLLAKVHDMSRRAPGGKWNPQAGPAACAYKAALYAISFICEEFEPNPEWVRNLDKDADYHLGRAIIYVEQADIGTGPAVAGVLGLDQNNWPIFVCLIEDGKEVLESAHAAKMITAPA